MAFYLVLYIVATLCAFCYAKAKTKIDILIFKTLLFLILFLPLALRYNIGTDYQTYVYLIKEYYFFKHSDLYFEPGWMPIIYAIEKWNLSLQWFFVVPAFFSTFIVLREDIIERKYAHFCIPVYLSLAYIDSFDIVRQAFAATIFLFCVKNLERKRCWKTFFWLIIAVLFHKSAVLYLPFLILASLDWKKLNQYRALTIYAIMVAVFVIYNAATLIITKIVGDTMYASYVTSDFNRPTKITSGLGVLAKQILFILVLFSIRKEEIDSTINQTSIRRYNIVCIGTLCLAAFHILATQIHIFDRLTTLFSPFYIYIATCLIKSKWKYRKWACLIFVSMLFILAAMRLYGSFIAGTGPGIIPYQSILTK